MTDRLDRDWLTAHPLPQHPPGTNKNSRGRVLIAGGAEFVPGALRLTGEAALRAGAGKLQLATVAPAAMALGVLVPEAAMIVLPEDGEGEIAPAAGDILARAVERCDAFVLGPGMSDEARAGALLRATIGGPREGLSLVLDAAAIGCARDMRDAIAAHRGRVVLTPHHGEMASCTGLSIEEIEADPERAARDFAAKFGAHLVLKSSETVIACPNGMLTRYRGGGVGLATGGSGDVLAGLVGGLLARGADPLTAAGWGVWLHGSAGEVLAERLGPIGFLARELLAEVPVLMKTAAGD